MIQKIKDLMKVKDDIDVINTNIEENNRLISELKGQLEVLREDFKQTKSMQNEFLKNFKDNLDVIKNLREDFGKEVFEFKMLKGQLQKKILEKFEEELQKDLNINRDSLKKDVEDYNELRKNVSEMIARLNLTGEELNKFLGISKNIKKEDFELTKFARQLIDMDKEKLELMRKIDALERLVSKIRRREIIR